MKRTNLEQEAQKLGFPATLMGFTPNDGPYWKEPGLPWLTVEMWENRPLGHSGFKLIWFIVGVEGQSMAPRFPAGCRVNVDRITKREQLAVGRVYLYVYRDPDTGQELCELGRLAKIGGNYLTATYDNYAQPALWLLGERARSFGTCTM